MPTLIPSSYFVHDAMQICLWFVFLGLAVATHTAQSDEGEFAMEKNTATNQFAGPDTNWQPSYRLKRCRTLGNRIQQHTSAIPPRRAEKGGRLVSKHTKANSNQQQLFFIVIPHVSRLERRRTR
jgi:hypothetical protein